MLSAKHKLRLIGSLATLAAAALTISCTGFFQNPTLSSIAVGPASPSIETGTTDNTVQMTVSGTNNDGSSNTHPSVAWSINPTSVATISSSGLVTSVSTGQATVTAAANSNPSITGSQTVTVTVGCILSIAVTPTNASISASTSNNTEQYDAKATTCNGVVEITSVASWVSSNTSVATIAGGLATAVAQGTTAITAQSGNIISPAVTLTVGP
jgi:hypothetical protein